MTMMPTLTTVTQHSIEVLATAIQEEKEIKGIQTGKGRSKTVTVCRWHDKHAWHKKSSRHHQKATGAHQ